MQKAPQPESSGFVKTLNNMGYMTSSLDPFSRQFVEFALRSPGPALDVGAAYGVASLAALELGATVISNDIDARHLEVLRSRVPAAQLDRLTTIAGAFPGELKLGKGSIGAALIARVLHFFPGTLIDQSFEALSEWLAPGGKVFIVAETPYLRNFQKFIPEYERRRAAGDRWPGFIDDVQALDPERGKFLPKTMHLLDPDVLSRSATQAGLTVEKCQTINRTDFPDDLRFDGRESVGLIGVKK